MPFYLWSKTASSNANDDSTINWAEGMAPSAVNDSARAMMARLREWGSDIAGSLVDTGTSTAYAVASNQVFDTLAHMDKAVIAFVPANTNTGTCTLAVDGLTAKPLRSAPSVDLPSGTLVAGTPYACTYNNSDGAFYLQNFFVNSFQIPLGGMMPYVGSSAPNTAFALPYGQAISRTTYATLFSLCSTAFGSGDGTTTFNIPDLRGRSIFGLDNMGGSAASRITAAGGNFDGTVLGGTGGGQNQTLTQAQLPTSIGSSSNFPANSIPNNITGAAQANTTGGNVAVPFWAAGQSFATSPITITNSSGGNAHPILPPAMVLPFILRII